VVAFGPRSAEPREHPDTRARSAPLGLSPSRIVEGGGSSQYEDDQHCGDGLPLTRHDAFQHLDHRDENARWFGQVTMTADRTFARIEELTQQSVRRLRASRPLSAGENGSGPGAALATGLLEARSHRSFNRIHSLPPPRYNGPPPRRHRDEGTATNDGHWILTLTAPAPSRTSEPRPTPPEMHVAGSSGMTAARLLTWNPPRRCGLPPLTASHNDQLHSYFRLRRASRTSETTAPRHDEPVSHDAIGLEPLPGTTAHRYCHCRQRGTTPACRNSPNDFRSGARGAWRLWLAGHTPSRRSSS
jgi:hypothetical protein